MRAKSPPVIRGNKHHKPLPPSNNRHRGSKSLHSLENNNGNHHRTSPPPKVNHNKTISRPPPKLPPKPFGIKPKAQTMHNVLSGSNNNNNKNKKRDRVSIKANVTLNENELSHLEKIDNEDSMESNNNIEVVAEIDEYENSDDGVCKIYVICHQIT